MPAARKARKSRRSQTDRLLTTQNQILDYLRQDVEEWKKAGARYDRQQTATLQARAAISEALARQGEALRDIHAITTRVLEQSNHIMLQLGASGATH